MVIGGYIEPTLHYTYLQNMCNKEWSYRKINLWHVACDTQQNQQEGFCSSIVFTRKPNIFGVQQSSHRPTLSSQFQKYCTSSFHPIKTPVYPPNPIISSQVSFVLLTMFSLKSSCGALAAKHHFYLLCSHLKGKHKTQLAQRSLFQQEEEVKCLQKPNQVQLFTEIKP